MNTTNQKDSKSVSIADIRDRGRALAIRFRVAGFPQYTRWFLDHKPQWLGDTSRLYRIRMIMNERGGLDDIELLKECEGLADRFLPKQAA